MTRKNGPRITSRFGVITSTPHSNMGNLKLLFVGVTHVSIDHTRFHCFSLTFSIAQLAFCLFLTAIFLCSADTPKLNKDLLRVARGCGLASALLTISREERDAPTIFDYEATYGGRIRGKAIDGGEKEKDSQVDPSSLPEELLPSQDKPLRGVLR